MVEIVGELAVVPIELSYRFADPGPLSVGQRGEGFRRTTVDRTRSRWLADTAVAAICHRASDPGFELRRLDRWTDLFSDDRSPDEAGHLSNAVHGFFSNGGRSCYLVPVRFDSPTAIDLSVLGTLGDVGTVCWPDLAVGYAEGAIDLDGMRHAQQSMLDHCEAVGDRISLLDTPPALSASEVRQLRQDELVHDSSFGALYYPWIRPASTAPRSAYFPPSAHVAGVLARVDRFRGVHAPPGSELVADADEVQTNLQRSEHDLLNPIGVNCLMVDSAGCVRVRGVRSLSPDREWQQLRKRRLIAALTKQLRTGLAWVAGATDTNESLGAQIEHDVHQLLEIYRRSGAFDDLTSLSATETFGVSCDLAGAGPRPPVVTTFAIIGDRQLNFRITLPGLPH